MNVYEWMEHESTLGLLFLLSLICMDRDKTELHAYERELKGAEMIKV